MYRKPHEITVEEMQSGSPPVLLAAATTSDGLDQKRLFGYVAEVRYLVTISRTTGTREEQAAKTRYIRVRLSREA